jgi:signal transduction histidine kinase
MAAEAASRHAEEANEAKASFLRTMSHELRTPLNAIIGYADLLIDGVRGQLTPVQATDVTRIRRAAMHLLTLINEVLNWARPEPAPVTVGWQLILVGDVVAATRTMIEPQALGKHVSVDCPPCDPTLAVRGDRDKVLQILLNLLANAVKFTPPGGQVSVTCTGNGTVRIAVRDTGPGIEPEQLERVFEPFVQVRRTYDSSHTGVGLGLAISRQWARAMGGDVTVESEVGAGSVFTLILNRGYVGAGASSGDLRLGVAVRTQASGV